jgi:hypothetical protein
VQIFSRVPLKVESSDVKGYIVRLLVAEKVCILPVCHVMSIELSHRVTDSKECAI